MKESTSLLVSRLKHFLDLPDSDHWYDVASCDARAILDRDGETLLSSIASEIAAWPPLMQEHLAYILGDSGSAVEMNLLSTLAESTNADVAFRAREVLRGIRRANDKQA